jgi:hypothetical protein
MIKLGKPGLPCFKEGLADFVERKKSPEYHKIMKDNILRLQRVVSQIKLAHMRMDHTKDPREKIYPRHD